MTRSEALKSAVIRLTSAGIDTPDRDARLLLLDTERLESAALTTDPEAEMLNEQAYLAAISRRAAREPVSKILGYRDFWTQRFIVTPDVLDPRPDTETLIEAVLDYAQKDPPLRIVDLGTGSGCILLTLLHELPSSKGLAVDRSLAALEVAKRNAIALKLADRVDFLVSDWLEGVDEAFDLVVCNPPYISTAERDSLDPEVSQWDPDAALFAGMDGLQAYREIADGLATVLKPNGTAFFEIGIGQGDAVTALFEGAGFRRVSSRKDLGGRERCLVFQR